MVTEVVGLILSAIGGLYLAVGLLRPKVKAHLGRVATLGKRLAYDPLGVLAQERLLAAIALLGILASILIGAEAQVTGLREQGFGAAASWFIPTIVISGGLLVIAMPVVLFLRNQNRRSARILLVVASLPGLVVLGLYSIFGFLLFSTGLYTIAASAILAGKSAEILGFKRSMTATGAFLVATGSILQLIAKLLAG